MSCFPPHRLGETLVCPQCNVSYVFSPTVGHQCSVASKRKRYEAYVNGWQAGAANQLHANDPSDDYAKGYREGRQARKDAMTKASVTYGFEPAVVRVV